MSSLQAKGCLRLSPNSYDLWFRGWPSCGSAERLVALWHNPQLLARFELCSSWRCVALTKKLSVAHSRRVQLTAQVTLCGLCCSALCNIYCLIPFEWKHANISYLIGLCGCYVISHLQCLSYQDLWWRNICCFNLLLSSGCSIQTRCDSVNALSLWPWMS